MRRILLLLAGLPLALPTVVGSASVAAPLPEASSATAPSQLSQPAQAEQVGTEETVAVDLGPARSATIERPGAWYVKVHVTGLRLDEGDALTVASRDGTEIHTYRGDPARSRMPGDADAAVDATGFWAMSITGDRAVVSLRSAGSKARIDKIARGFTGQELAARDVGPRSICGSDDKKDVVCYQSSNPTQFARTPAVARVLMNGSSMCTAWRAGPNNRMVTNNHCFSTSTTARNTEVWFNYQCTTCGGSTSATLTKVMGNSVLKTNSTYDLTLFDVQSFASISSFGYLELENRLAAAGEELYIIGHPGGRMKKMSLTSDQDGGNCKVSGSDSVDIAYRCDTEGGSSGSPVLSRRTNKVIGLHHLGGCPNEGVRADRVFAQIGSLL